MHREQIHEALFRSAEEGLAVLRAHGGDWFLVDVNPAAARALELDVDQVGQPVGGRLPIRVTETLRRALREGERVAGDPVAEDDRWEVIEATPLDDRTVALRHLDVTDRVEAAASRARLEGARAELQRFAHLASHDLQEPLRLVAMYGQLLERRAVLDDTARHHLDIILDSAQRLYALVDAVVALADVEGAPVPDAEVDLHQLVGDVVGELGPDAREAHIRWTGLPSVHGSPALLRQLFTQLLDNALTYRGPDPPRIEITARPEGDRWHLVVADNGIGLAPAQADAVFEPFRRLHAYEAYRGTGIGLAICARVVARHGGRIWVASEKGRGARFHIVLPRHLPRIAAA